MKIELIKDGDIRYIAIDGVRTDSVDEWYLTDFCVFLQAVRNHSDLFIRLEDDLIVVEDGFKQDTIPANFCYSFEYLVAFFKQFGVELSFKVGAFEC